MGDRPTASEIARARRLRQSAGLAERKAWDVLRKFRQHGFPIRRQHPVAGFTVDFACPKARLVIEIDGGIHNLSAVQQRDITRQHLIEMDGWRVIRIRNEDALDPDHVWDVVGQALGLF